eukprot:COSAG02_NODE_299_length_25349_cov_53.762020_8_plen_191_part_00
MLGESRGALYDGSAAAARGSRSRGPGKLAQRLPNRLRGIQQPTQSSHSPSKQPIERNQDANATAPRRQQSSPGSIDRFTSHHQASRHCHPGTQYQHQHHPGLSCALRARKKSACSAEWGVTVPEKRTYCRPHGRHFDVHTLIAALFESSTPQTQQRRARGAHRAPTKTTAISVLLREKTRMDCELEAYRD